MGKPSDRNKEIMHDMWGTKKLVTDYDSIEEQNSYSVIKCLPKG